MYPALRRRRAGPLPNSVRSRAVRETCAIAALILLGADAGVYPTPGGVPARVGAQPRAAGAALRRGVRPAAAQDRSPGTADGAASRRWTRRGPQPAMRDRS